MARPADGRHLCKASAEPYAASMNGERLRRLAAAGTECAGAYLAHHH